MPDMLVKLYEIAPDPALAARIAAGGYKVRRILPPELRALTAWIAPRFGEGWASEATCATVRQPPAVFIATKDGELAGFACYDATARGFFGPTGVGTAHRGKGVGQALLLATLLDMRDQGYGYGIIGAAGPTEFYARTIGAIPIEGSVPGIYADMLPIAAPSEA